MSVMNLFIAKYVLMHKDAYDELIASIRARKKSNTAQLFDSFINHIPSELEEYARECIRNQQYDRLEKLLEKLSDLRFVCNTVKPALNNEKISKDVTKMVKDEVHGKKVALQSSWEAHDYKTLNQSITDLTRMESHFRCIPEVFPTSWNDGIAKSVEEKIESLGEKAKSYVRDKTTAGKHMRDFRDCFMNMGKVFIELEN